ncbi:hypothetical protein SHKM778_26710 [Streptomyces sp. KM77-8]|uniref:Uncharacterized protein n=1 Tax=Streptomyces haneummycinicus TaxID=3074435 RepID=A0AAT9HG79_9ACTN
MLLNTLLKRLWNEPTPLSPVADAWRVFKEAADRAPEPAERLLLAPTTGAWIAHTLRRAHGTATGPRLWVEAARMNTLAVVAALQAGTEASLRVPLEDGALHLPGLGLLRLADAAPGVSAGRASTRAGVLTLSGPGPDGTRRSLTRRPAPVPVTGAPSADDPHWLPSAPSPSAAPPYRWRTWTPTATSTTPCRPPGWTPTRRWPGSGCSTRPWRSSRTGRARGPVGWTPS